MTADNPIGGTDLYAQADRENRIELALLRGVVENLRSNRVVVPLFGLAIMAMFPQWVGLDRLTGWYCQMMLGLVPQVIVLARFPDGALDPSQTRRWSRILAAANLFFIANWASLGLWMWAGGDKNSNHIMIQLILAATLAAHAAGTGPCRTIARPALFFYLVAMTLVPLQGIAFGPTALRSWIMALSAPFYVAFIAMVGRRNERRAGRQTGGERRSGE